MTLQASRHAHLLAKQQRQLLKSALTVPSANTPGSFEVSRHLTGDTQRSNGKRKVPRGDLTPSLGIFRTPDLLRNNAQHRQRPLHTSLRERCFTEEHGDHAGPHGGVGGLSYSPILGPLHFRSPVDRLCHSAIPNLLCAPYGSHFRLRNEGQRGQATWPSHPSVKGQGA